METINEGQETIADLPTTPVDTTPTLTNQGGLLYDQQGIVRGIEVPISAEPITGFKRVARHESLIIGADLQMVQRVRIVRLNADGVELSSALAKDLTLNDNVRSQLLNTYQDTIYPATTQGAYVDAATGMPTDLHTPGAVEQLAFFQGISIAVLKGMGQPITKTSSVPVLIYQLLLAEIIKLDAQGRL